MHPYSGFEWTIVAILWVLNIAAVFLALSGDRDASRRQPPEPAPVAALDRWGRWAYPVLVFASLTIPFSLVAAGRLPTSARDLCVAIFILLHVLIQRVVGYRKSRV